MLAVLGRLSAGENLSQEEMTATIDSVMRGDVPDEQIALLLTALRAKGETVEEIAGAALSLRGHMTRIRTRHEVVVDTCGTGGVGSKLFNISTAAAIVTAAGGLPVAKHGNRAVTSRTGSADVLAELGVDISADVPTLERCLNELDICFCFAPVMHPSMKRVAQVRRQLGVPTIFNLLGPLCNPAGAPYQLLGVGRPELRRAIAEALALLGTKRAAVVTGQGDLGEVTTAGVTDVCVVADGTVEEHRWTPSHFGLPTTETLASLEVQDAKQSAELIRGVLAGEKGLARDIVVANSAAAFWVAGSTPTLQEGAARAQMAIDNGHARCKLEKLIEMTNAQP